MSRKQDAIIEKLEAEVATLETKRDALLARYEAGVEVDPEELNAIHDAIYDTQQAVRQVWLGAIPAKGDWNDRTSRWHY
jgi:hypothetical protein